MTRGEHRPTTPSADALLVGARARAAERAQPAAHTNTLSISVPSARAVKTVAWWTLGIVLCICALPFVLWGLSIAMFYVASLFYEPYTRPFAALWTALMLAAIYGTHIGAVVWSVLRDRRRAGREGAPEAEGAAEIAAAMVERQVATLH